MSSPGFFEVHITTHQHGSSETDYRAVHRQMVARGFERVIQTAAQIANEVPGLYRLHNAPLAMTQVVEMTRLALAPLGRGMAVRVLKIDEETLCDFIPATSPAQTGTKPKSKAKAQSGYPTWRRPR
jgi:hypothetical protein